MISSSLLRLPSPPPGYHVFSTAGHESTGHICLFFLSFYLSISRRRVGCCRGRLLTPRTPSSAVCSIYIPTHGRIPRIELSGRCSSAIFIDDVGVRGARFRLFAHCYPRFFLKLISSARQYPPPAQKHDARNHNSIPYPPCLRNSQRHAPGIGLRRI